MTIGNPLAARQQPESHHTRALQNRRRLSGSPRALAAIAVPPGGYPPWWGSIRYRGPAGCHAHDSVALAAASVGDGLPPGSMLPM